MLAPWLWRGIQPRTRWRFWLDGMRREARLLLRGWCRFHVRTKTGWALWQDRLWRMPRVYLSHLFFGEVR
jgi:hypothetical protein